MRDFEVEKPASISQIDSRDEMLGRVHVIIPVHNYYENTRGCLENLVGQSYKRLEIIVVDDGSQDGTAQKVAAAFPGVKVIQGDGTLWWAGSTNLGIKYALNTADSGDYVLTLNNDTAFDEHYIARLVQRAKENDRSIIGSLAVSAENPMRVVDSGVRVNWRTARFTDLPCDITAHLHGIHEVDVLPGRGTLFPIAVYQTVGLYDEKRLPHYGADYEFTWRAKKHGYKLLIDYSSIVRSDTKTTGLNNRIHRTTWQELLRSFVTIKSPLQLKARWSFAIACLGIPAGMLFFLFDLARVIGGSIRAQLASGSGEFS